MNNKTVILYAIKLFIFDLGDKLWRHPIAFNWLIRCCTGYDCPIFSGMYDYVSAIAGSSLAMASTLVSGECMVGINWHGGWHHSKKSVTAAL